LRQQFSVDALYPHREHLPAKVRTFIELLAKNLHQIDFDAPTVSSTASRPAPKQRNLG
jgi:hypothetical protein